jgi:hypothetical protein
MATRADVRRIALSLPHVAEADGHFAFEIPVGAKHRGFVWVWMERVAPKQPRVANVGVVAIRVSNVTERDTLIASEPAKFFTEPHYQNFPAVLVRLAAVNARELRVLLEAGWRCMAPTKMRAAFDAR